MVKISSNFLTRCCAFLDRLSKSKKLKRIIVYDYFSTGRGISHIILISVEMRNLILVQYGTFVNEMDVVILIHIFEQIALPYNVAIMTEKLFVLYDLTIARLKHI